MTRGAGTTSRTVKKPSRKAATPRRTPKTAHTSAQSTPSIDDPQEQISRLRRERDEALEREAATAKVLRVISSSQGELQPIFEAILENAVRICEAKFGMLFQFDGDAFHLTATLNLPPELADYLRQRGLYRPGPGLPLHRLLQAKAVVHTVDQAVEQAQPPSAKLGSARTHIAVPMLKEGRVVGAIAIYRQEVRPFTDKQIELVQNFADQAVIAIENARLLNELRQRTDDLTEALEQQTATSEVLGVISSSPGELQPVFQAMLENATRICGAKFGNLLLREGEFFRIAASHGAPPAYQDFLRREPIVPRKPNNIYKIAETKQPVQIADIKAEPTYGSKSRIALIELAGGRTLIGVPMLKDGEVIGGINIYRQEVQLFSDRQIELVQNFAAQAVIAIENTRLLNELRQRTDDLTESLEQQTATSEVLQVISSSPGELEPVFQAMLEKAVNICDAKFGILFRWEGDAFRTVAMHDLPQALADERRRNPVLRPNPRTGLGRLVETKRAIQVADVQADPGYQADPVRRAGIIGAGGARTLISVPMLKENELVGAIGIYRQEVRPFTDKQIELVENFAAQAVIAIENTRLLNELRESLQQQTATADVLKVISRSTFDLQTVLDTLSESVARLCEAYDAVLLLRQGEKLQAKAHYGPIDATMSDWPINPNWVAGRAVIDRVPVHVHDLSISEEFPDGRQLAIREGHRTILAVPLLRENEAIGAIAIRRLEVKPYTDKQIELVKTFADQAVIAIENVRLFDEVQARTRDLSESLEQQTATSEVLKVISSSPGELEPVFNAMLENATRICEAKFGNLLLFENGNFRRVALYGAPLDWANHVEQNPTFRPNETNPIYRLPKTKQTIHVIDIMAEPAYLEDPTLTVLVRKAGARTVVTVPMLKDNELVGAISIYRQEVHPFTEKQIDLLKNFAAQAVIAIENARLLNELRQRTDDLSRSLEDLRTTQDRLVQTEKLASLGQLTAGIAHEIKNPLNFVNNFSGVTAELINELQETLGDVSLNEKKRAEIGELTDTLRSNLDKVVQHGRRADAIVKNMLLHSRQGSAEHRPVDINALVEESLNLAYHGARAERQGFNITLERSLDPAAGEADVFPQDITRVLLNVISNGFYAATKRKAQADGGGYEPTLMAGTKNLGDRVEIRIRDNGIGIPPEVKEQMFNPFFTTKPAGEGTGLGLSISHDVIVKQHGGSIEVDSEPDQYTEFRIVLPRKAATLGEGRALA